MGSDPTCCFCCLVIRESEDPLAMRVKVGPLSGEVRQILYAHSQCFRSQLHEEVEFWWEY
jgi:hypothetical protein